MINELNSATPTLIYIDSRVDITHPHLLDAAINNLHNYLGQDLAKLEAERRETPTLSKQLVQAERIVTNHHRLRERRVLAVFDSSPECGTSADADCFLKFGTQTTNLKDMEKFV